MRHINALKQAAEDNFEGVAFQPSSHLGGCILVLKATDQSDNTRLPELDLQLVLSYSGLILGVREGKKFHRYQATEQRWIDKAGNSVEPPSNQDLYQDLANSLDQALWEVA